MMLLELISVGLTEDHRQIFEAKTIRHGVAMRHCRDIDELPLLLRDQSTHAAEVLVASFESAAQFRDLRQRYLRMGLGSFCVAVLPGSDFKGCRDAVRAGADDVVALPLDGAEIDALVQHMRRLVAGTVHPDAILPLNMVEKIAIKTALMACNGQVSKTSRKLGIGRSTLYRKLEQYEISARP